MKVSLTCQKNRGEPGNRGKKQIPLVLLGILRYTIYSVLYERAVFPAAVRNRDPTGPEKRFRIFGLRKGAITIMVTLTNDKGRICVTNEVFTNLAGNAATSCFGVKGMVGRAKDSGPFQLLRRESMSKGVEVHFNDDESVSLELHIGVDQGVNISAVSRSIMKEVSYKLTKATGVPVKRVDVFVDTIIG